MPLIRIIKNCGNIITPNHFKNTVPSVLVFKIIHIQGRMGMGRTEPFSSFKERSPVCLRNPELSPDGQLSLAEAGEMVQIHTQDGQKLKS